MRRFVETELFLQALDHFRVQASGTVVGAVGSRSHGPGGGDRSSGGHIAKAGKTGNGLFHRSARRELNDDEVDQHDAEQRWRVFDIIGTQ